MDRLLPVCYLDESVVQKAQHNALCNDRSLCHRFFSIICLPLIKPQLTSSLSLFTVNRNDCDDLAQKEPKGFKANLTSNSAMTKSYQTRHHRNRHKNPHYRHKMLKRKVDMRDFEILRVLGTGAYGTGMYLYILVNNFVKTNLYLSPITSVSCSQN